MVNRASNPLTTRTRIVRILMTVSRAGLPPS
jgi:hypothetical protein